MQAPQRPAMPTEALAVDAALDDFVAAAAAEIERREGYEQLLRAALAACSSDGGGFLKPFSITPAGRGGNQL